MEAATGSFEKVLEAGVWEWLWMRRRPRDSGGAKEWVVALSFINVPVTRSVGNPFATSFDVRSTANQSLTEGPTWLGLGVSVATCFSVSSVGPGQAALQLARRVRDAVAAHGFGDEI